MKFSAVITDSLKSMIGNLGNEQRDKRAGVTFDCTTLTDDQLIQAYSGNWVARKIVDIPAQDSLSKWRVWGGDQREAIEAEEKRLGYQRKMLEAKIKGRLFGGAAVYIGTSQEPSEPLDVDRIGKGGIEFLTVLTRKELLAGDIERDPLSPLYGQPEDYQVANSTTQARIHPSRLIRFLGNKSPDSWMSSANSGWGESVLQSTHNAIKDAIGTSANVASLVYEANIDVIGVPDLMENVGNSTYESEILKRFALAAQGKSINGTLIIDALESYERKSASFAQLPELMDSFYRLAAASSDIPITRFLGRSPAGMQSTGDGDMNNYHDKIYSEQTLEIGPAMALGDEALIRSALGSRPDDLDYEWTPLKQMSEKDMADIGKTLAESLKIISELGEGGAFTPQEIKDLTVSKLSESKAFPNIESIVSEAAARLELEPEDDKDSNAPSGT